MPETSFGLLCPDIVYAHSLYRPYDSNGECRQSITIKQTLLGTGSPLFTENQRMVILGK